MTSMKHGGLDLEYGRDFWSVHDPRYKKVTKTTNKAIPKVSKSLKGSNKKVFKLDLRPTKKQRIKSGVKSFFNSLSALGREKNYLNKNWF